jgi:hypothetical protein
MTLTDKIAELRARYASEGLTLHELAQLAALERQQYENTATQRATARRIIASARRGDRVWIRTDRGSIPGRVTLKHGASLVVAPEGDRWAKPIRATELNVV